MPLHTAVIDTADWMLAVPIQGAAGSLVDFSDTRISVDFTPTHGGGSIARASTDNGSLAFVEAAEGVPTHFAIDLPAAQRTWRTSAPVSIVGDILREPEPGRTEWLGRITFVAHPGSSSSGIAAPRPGPTLVPAQPYNGRVVASPLQVGAQGAPGEIGGFAVALKAADTLGGHRVVYATIDGVRLASADLLTSADRIVGITAGAAQSGSFVDVQPLGPMEEPSWNWSLGPVFLGLDGLLTQIPPRASFEQRVGTAISPTRLMIDIEPAFYLT